MKRLLLRESQVQPLLSCSRTCTGSTPRPRRCSTAWSRACRPRMLLLVNYRPEYQHGWGSKTYYRQLRIDPLPPESAEELLEVCSDMIQASAAQAAADRANRGQPVLPRGERPDAGRDPGVGRRAGRVSRGKAARRAIQVPATVQAILAARIDRLSPEDKRLLQAASVIGKDVPFALLQAIAEIPEEAVRRGLDRLQAAEFLYETRLFPDLEYTFKHALTHEVAYGSLLQERRRVLHARIVEAIERLHAGPPGRTRRAAGPPCVARRGVGEGRRPTSARPGRRPASARPIGKPSRTSSRRWPPSSSSAREPRDDSSRRSTCASTCAPRCSRSANSSGYSSTYVKQNHRPDRLNDPRRLGWIAYHLGGIYVTTGQITESASAFFQSAYTLACERWQIVHSKPRFYGIGAALRAAWRLPTSYGRSLWKCSGTRGRGDVRTLWSRHGSRPR